MKRVLLLYFSIFTIHFSFSQNLVPNYSFEDTIKCNNNTAGFVGYVAEWGGGGMAAGTYYLNSYCNPSGSELGVPLNVVGYQEPHTGHAYTWITTMMKYYPPTPKDTNARGYVQAKLTTPLMAGVTYYATYWVSLADSSMYACNNMGIYFSDSALTYPTVTYVKSNLIPQIQNDPINHPLNDAENWIKISGKYTAVGGEKYIVIGNFTPNYLCDTSLNDIHSLTALQQANYYIDDIILSPDSNYADSLMCVKYRAVYAHAGKDTSICGGGQALIGQDTAQSGVSYYWQPTTGLANPNAAQTLASPTVTTTYTLTVVNDSMQSCGCDSSVNSSTVTIEVCPQSIYVPDAFSPNNDGQNDVFLVKGNDIQSFDLFIYDRWGNKVFESESENIGWDGTYKGQPENAGTYVYYLKGTYTDGTAFERKGNVTLVR